MRMGVNSNLVLLLLQCSSIGIGAILGVLTRIGVNMLFGPARASITSREDVLFFDLPANVLGCFALGVHTSMRTAWDIPPTLNLGLSTGYAGSLTSEFLYSLPACSYVQRPIAMNLTSFVHITADGYQAFASWHLQVIQMLIDGNVLRGILAMFVGLCLAIIAMLIGADFGTLIIYASQRVNVSLICKSRVPPECVVKGGDQESPHHSNNTYSSGLISTAFVLALFVSLLAGMIAGAVVDGDDTNSSRLFWTSAAFAPVGALLRWRLSFLNRLKPLFPIGTYIANMLALILDLALLTARGIHRNLSSEASFLFTAVIAGLGGSLSTVSTWISEALNLPTAQRYFNILTTMASAILLGLIIYGIPVWVHAI